MFADLYVNTRNNTSEILLPEQLFHHLVGNHPLVLQTCDVSWQRDGIQLMAFPQIRQIAGLLKVRKKVDQNA